MKGKTNQHLVLLIKSERTEEAYRRFGLQTATGPTYLSIYRDMAKRYPEQGPAPGGSRRGVSAASGSPRRRMKVSSISRCRARGTSRSSLPLSWAPRGILLSRSRDAVKQPRFGLKSGWSLCSVCSTAAAMIRQFRRSRRLLTISWVPHRGSARGIGPMSRLRASSTPLLSGPQAPAARPRRILDAPRPGAGRGLMQTMAPARRRGGTHGRGG